MKTGLKIFLTALIAVPLIVIAVLLGTMWYSYDHSSEKSDGDISINYRNADDLERATGVAFPEAELLDSLFHKDYDRNFVRLHFSNGIEQDRKFQKRLKKACNKDPKHWSMKKGESYTFLIFPDSMPVDRGTEDRMETLQDGRVQPARSGNYLKIIIPADGSAITVEEGWQRYAR